jgi:hypothetical protein
MCPGPSTRTTTASAGTGDGRSRPPRALCSQRGPDWTMPQISKPSSPFERTPISARWYFAA